MISYGRVCNRRYQYVLNTNALREYTNNEEQCQLKCRVRDNAIRIVRRRKYITYEMDIPILECPYNQTMAQINLIHLVVDRSTYTVVLRTSPLHMRKNHVLVYNYKKSIRDLH